MFGISFVRGTIRVNLRQFFQMTTVILMVVVVQLVITGLHELSLMSQVLPASTQEMALIGPIVKNDIFFFVTILALAAAMILLEWRKRRAPRTEALEGAALRKAQWSARRERLWMMAACVACGAFILMITAESIYSRQETALSAAAPVTLDNGAVRIPVVSVSDGVLHRFQFDDAGVSVRFIVIEKADHTLATAFDACSICGTQGFYQKGPECDLQELRVGNCYRDDRDEGRVQSDSASVARADGAMLVIDQAAFEHEGGRGSRRA